MKCSNCNKENVHAKGFCGSCYSRWLKTGSPEKTKVRKDAECKHCGAFGFIKGRGYCSPCYTRWLKKGTPERIKVKKREACDYCGIESEIKAKGLCNKCYDRKLDHGSPEYLRVRNICSVNECDNTVKGNGLCAKHYKRYLRHGHTDQTRPINYGKIGKHPLKEQWRYMTKRSVSANIMVSKEWRDDFETFVRDVGPKPSPNHTLQLLDKNGIYEKGNVEWIEKTIIKKKSETQKEYMRRFAREDRINHPLKHKDRQLRKNFKITLDDYNNILMSQNGKCAICCKDETEYNKNGHKFSLSVDHCHTTGKIRGILCGHCNKSLGGFKDSIELLEKAIEYLKKHKF